jgi:hypothetical protein
LHIHSTGYRSCFRPDIDTAVAAQGCRLVPYSGRHPENTILYPFVQHPAAAGVIEHDGAGLDRTDGQQVPTPAKRSVQS